MSLPTHQRSLQLIRECSWIVLLLGIGAACSNSSKENSALLTLSGTVRDYVSDAPLAAADLAIEELPLSTAGQANGSFEFTGIPRHSILTVTAVAPNYRPTRNDTVQFETKSIVRPIQAVATADVTRQYTILSLTATAGTAMVIATLVDGGAPLEGVPLVDITLQDAGMAPVGNGPYIVGAGGDVDPALTVSTAFGGRSRIAFLNVPTGLHTLQLTIPGGPPRTRTANISTASGGVTLATP